MRTRVSVVPHTHWDREWYAPFQVFRLRLVELMDGLLSMLEADPQFSHFLLDGQVAVLDDYLDARPDAEARLRELVSSGRVDVGPWYTLPDEFCISGETLIRNLQIGLRRAADFGGGMALGYLPDMFGHVAQMPQMLRLFGFDTAVVWRGVPSAVDRTAFWWSSPDGSTVRAEYLWHGYGNGAALPADAAAVLAHVDGLRADVGAALAGDLLVLNGSDHLRPQPELPRLLAETGRLRTDTDLVLTSLTEALAHSAAHSAAQSVHLELPRWDGELRSGARANLLMGVASNRVDIKQAAARAERSLERRAEPLSALWCSPDAWPDRLLSGAWHDMVLNAAHDSSCACSVDEVCTAVLHRYTEARQIGDGLADRALRSLAATMEEPGAVVVNPAARRRGGVVELLVPGEGPVVHGQVLEAQPTVHSDRVLSPGDARSWMLWFRSQRIDDATFVNAVEIAERDDTVELTLHCDRRLRDNLLVEQIKADVAGRLAARPGTPLHLRIIRSPMRRVLWRIDAVPGYGWRRWEAEPTAAAGVVVTAGETSTVATNGLVRVEIDHATATWAINGTAGFGRLVDSGDHGDTYNYSPPDHDVWIDGPEQVDVEVVEDGPVRARVRIVAVYRWPEGIDDARRARAGDVATPVETIVEIHAGEPIVRVSHAWYNLSRDHRVRAVLPLMEPAVESHAECAFAVVRRGLQAEGGPTERGLATSFSRRFVQAGGLTVIHDGLLEYELTDRHGRSLDAAVPSAHAVALTLLRSTGMLSHVEMAYRPLPAGPPIAMDGPQLLGPVRARYAVCAEPSADPWALADDVLLPLEVVVAPGGGGVVEPEGSALNVGGAQVSALLRDGPGGAQILRVFNPTPQAAVLTVEGRAGDVIDLRDRVVEHFDGQCPLAPWQIVTVRLT